MTTVRQHLASRNNLRQQRVVALGERGQRAVEQGRAARVELTPETQTRDLLDNERGKSWQRS